MYVFFGLFVFVGFFFYSGQVNSNCLPLYNSFYYSPLKPWSILDTLYKSFEWRWTKHCQGLHPSPQRSSSTISGPEGKDRHLSLCTVPQGSELSLKCLHGLGKGPLDCSIQKWNCLQWAEIVRFYYIQILNLQNLCDQNLSPPPQKKNGQT